MSQAISHLAVLLRDKKELFLQQWIKRVLADEQLPKARALDEISLRDFVPTMIDELVDSLTLRAQQGEQSGATGPQIGGGRAAEAHVDHRFAEGYSLASR